MTEEPDRGGAKRFPAENEGGSPFGSVTTKVRAEVLMAACSSGCTPRVHFEPRWTDDVFALRDLGIRVETRVEANSRPFRGTHERYATRSSMIAAADVDRGWRHEQR